MKELKLKAKFGEDPLLIDSLLKKFSIFRVTRKNKHRLV